jgi:hypothetical protein
MSFSAVNAGMYKWLRALAKARSETPRVGNGESHSEA